MKYKLQRFFTKDFPITQKFGNNPEYYKQFGFAGHEGIDYGTPVGIELLSPFDGKVVRDVDNPKLNAYGEHIVVWDPMQKIALWFCHLDSNYVSVGDIVKAGQTLGYTGNTGNTTGPHCHVNFCETDTSGNRLHTDNEYKGFLNLLDYCEFVESATIAPMITDQTKIPQIVDENGNAMEVQRIRSILSDQQRLIISLKEQLSHFQDNPIDIELETKVQRLKEASEEYDAAQEALGII